MSDEEPLFLPDELHDEEMELRTFQFDYDINVELICAPEHLQMTDRSAFLVVWPASISMAKYLIAEIMKNKHEYSSLKVLELGSGVGLCGLAIAEMIRKYFLSEKSDSFVVLSDLDISVLNCLHKSMESLSGNYCFAEKLAWGDISDVNKLRDKYLQGSSTTGFDIIIGTDVTYSTKSISSLMWTASNLLVPSTGRLFISFSTRFLQLLELILSTSSEHNLTLLSSLTTSPTTQLLIFNKSSH
jgi:predicted nicotinamide N-methyase